MNNLISYHHSHRLKVGMWLGAALMVALIFVYQSASAYPSDSYIVRVVPICILAFFWVFFLRRSGINQLADEVRDFGDRLEVRRGKTVGVVPLTRISLVESSSLLGTMPVVSLTLLDKIPFGDQISFLPRYVRGQTAWPSEAGRIAAELTARIIGARRNPVD